MTYLGPGRLVVSAVCVVTVVAGLAWLVRSPVPPTEAGLPVASSGAPTSTLPPPNTAPPEQAVAATSGRTVVHVAGAVAHPGVYELDADARVDTVISMAGGATGDADLDGVNLAAVLVDGQRIYVPRRGEVDPAAVPSGATGSVPSTATTGPIDINTATTEQLETLTGVGPATAAAIVDDRARNGPFASVEDLERVPGIGPAKLAAIADSVTV